MVSFSFASHNLPLSKRNNEKACTSTVTQISYHDKPSIEADIEFLSEADWREELAKLLSDVQSDRNGVRDAKAVSGQAFIKVRSCFCLLCSLLDRSEPSFFV